MFQRDNYEYPNASVTGEIIDSLTKERIQQDVFGGSYIQYYQQNFGPVEEAQNFQLKYDGTWTNTQVFAGDYYFIPQNKNFICAQDTIKNCKFTKGENTHFVIEGRPLHKIYDVDIHIDDETNELVAAASFYTDLYLLTPTQDVFAYWTDNMTVYIDPAPYVGEFYNRFKVKEQVSWPIVGDYRKEIRVSLDNPDLVKEIKRGEKYYVRIGVQTFGDSSRGAEFQGLAPYNFCEAVRIQF